MPNRPLRRGGRGRFDGGVRGPVRNKPLTTLWLQGSAHMECNSQVSVLPRGGRAHMAWMARRFATRIGAIRANRFAEEIIFSLASSPPTPKNTHPNKNNLHKQFAQTLSACFLLIFKGKGGTICTKCSEIVCANCTFIWVGVFFRVALPFTIRNVRASRANRLRPAIRNFYPPLPERDSQKRG